MTSVKQEFRKFGETVSVRGVPKILKTKDRVLCTVWLLCVLASTAILVWQLTTLFIKYYSWPVTTTYGEQWKETPIFPDVTICNLYPLSRDLNSVLSWDDYINITNTEQAFYPYNESLIQTWLIDEDFANFPQELYNWIWDQIQTPSGYFMNLPVIDADTSNSCPSFVIDCTFFDLNWQQSPVNCKELVSSSWNSQYFQCYTFHLNNSLKQQMRGLTTVLYIDDFPRSQSQFNADLSPSARGVRVSVHSPGTKPDLTRGISVGPGTETTVKIVPTIRQRLSKPYSGSDCSNLKYLPGSTTELYTSDACYEVCYQEQILKACNCVSEFFQYTDVQLRQGNNKLCGNQSLLVNVTNYQNPQGIIDLLCSIQLLFSIDTDTCDNQCFSPCSEYLYDISVSSAPWPHVSYQRDFYETYIQECPKTYAHKFDDYGNLFKAYDDSEESKPENLTKSLKQLTLIEDNFLQINFVIDKNKPYSLVDKPFYSPDQMLALVGGSLSLWLGVTVMTAVEFVEFAYFLFLACKQKCKRKNNSGDTKPGESQPDISHIETQEISLSTSSDNPKL